MEIILLERVARLGQMGDTVKVKDGFARNYLLPQGKALRATDANRKRFESERVQLEARDLERKSEAEKVGAKLEGKTFVVIRAAGETGQLYGSVSTRDIAELLGEEGFTIARNQVELNNPIKNIGMTAVSIALHGDVQVDISLNIARTQDEADRQAAGEDLTSVDAIYGLDEDEAPSEEEIFEEGAAPEEGVLDTQDADEPEADSDEAPATDEESAGDGEETSGDEEAPKS